MDSDKNDPDTNDPLPMCAVSPDTDVDQQTPETSRPTYSDLMRQLNDHREKVNLLQEENLDLRARDLQQRQRIDELQKRVTRVACQLRKTTADLIQVSFEEDALPPVHSGSGSTPRTGAKEDLGSASGPEEISMPEAVGRRTPSVLAVSEAPPTMNLPPLGGPRNTTKLNSLWKRLKGGFQMRKSNGMNPQNGSTTAVLVIGGVGQEEPPSDSRSLFTAYPIYRETAKQFRSIGSRAVGPVGMLYVKQREMAVTHPPDENVDVMGSDGASSCIIAILRHTGSGAVGLAHFDWACMDDAVINMIQSVQKLTLQSGKQEGRYELSLIGGVTDPRGVSEQTFSCLMRALHKQAIEINLRLACIGELNTIVKKGIAWPILGGAGVNVKTGDIFPATFPDRGPEQALRNARCLIGAKEILAIYDCQLGLLKIGPFDYKPLADVDLWLMQPDDAILQRCASTPKIKSPDFVAQTRAAFKYIRDNPFPAITVFPDGRPHYYRRDERGLWSPLSPDK